MKKKKLFKSNLQMVIYIIVFILCIVSFIIIGKRDYQETEITEAQKFNNIYSIVSEDNLYVFSNATEVLQIINGKSGIILMGFPLNVWTKYTAEILNRIGVELSVDKIYYYDFLKDREESNGTYETIVNKLDVYVTVDDEGTKDLHAPTVLIVKDGEIIGYFDDTIMMKGNIKPEDYYNDYQSNILYQKYRTAIIEYMK